MREKAQIELLSMKGASQQKFDQGIKVDKQNFKLITMSKKLFFGMIAFVFFNTINRNQTFFERRGTRDVETSPETTLELIVLNFVPVFILRKRV